MGIIIAIPQSFGTWPVLLMYVNSDAKAGHHHSLFSLISSSGIESSLGAFPTQDLDSGDSMQINSSYKLFAPLLQLTFPENPVSSKNKNPTLRICEETKSNGKRLVQRQHTGFSF